jgi:hypothetical protein
MAISVRNGGFPEPLPYEPQRVVGARHAACGAETRVRLSRFIPAGVVRRVVCERCDAVYDAAAVADLGLVGPNDATVTAAAKRPHDSRMWRWGSIALAAIAVVGVLLLIRGDSGEPAPRPVEPAAPATGGASTATEARFVNQAGFSLAVPPGWERVEPEGGAAFAARSSDQTAEATLWIEDDPKLSFREFEARTAEQLRSLSGEEAEIVDRINAPTIAGTVIRMRADAPAESGVSAPYDVTLRATGPYRYYLATTVMPGASRQASEGVDLIHGSFVPETRRDGEIETTATPGPKRPREAEIP